MKAISSKKLVRGKHYRLVHSRFGTAVVECLKPAEDGGLFLIKEGTLRGINVEYQPGEQITTINSLAAFYRPSKTTAKNVRHKAVKKFVPMQQFGADHWSTFVYIETRCVDHGGKPDKRQMRCNPMLHPYLAHEGSTGEYPTRYKFGELKDHDDWDCCDDLEAAGLVSSVGTGINPQYKLTALGWQVVSLLRQHRANGGKIAEFEYNA